MRDQLQSVAPLCLATKDRQQTSTPSPRPSLPLSLPPPPSLRQDPLKRTMVICDPTLERVMGQKVVKMFGMQSLISPHRLHKL